MAQFKINEVVVVKSTGQEGVIKGREIIPVEGKRTRVEYVVKLGDGFSNWNTFERKDLMKKHYDAKPDGVISRVYDDETYGTKVTLVAITAIERHLVRDEKNMFEVRIKKHRTLNIGYAVYNPTDEYDESLGIRIAKSRALKKPFCSMESPFTGEFNRDTINAIMDVKGKYIIDNIERFFAPADEEEIEDDEEVYAHEDEVAE